MLTGIYLQCIFMIYVDCMVVFSSLDHTNIFVLHFHYFPREQTSEAIYIEHYFVTASSI